MNSMAKENNMLPWAAGAVIVIVLLIAAGLYLNKGPGGGGPTTSAYTTVPQPSVTTQTVSSITVTTVKNQTTAVAPNNVNCNGYNFTLSQAGQSSAGTCNWRIIGQTYMNVTLWGGSYKNVTLTLIQQNVTTAPFNKTYSVAPCTQASNVGYVSPGNYKVILTTGAAATCTTGAGSAVVRISH